MSKAILILGATGNQGGATLRHLATHPSSPQYTLLAATRNASSPGAVNLTKKYPGVKVVQGDVTDVPSLFNNASEVLKSAGQDSNIWGVFSVQVFSHKEDEIAQGNAVIDEALKHGVKHFIYASVERGGNERSWNNETPIPHFQSKYEIEKHLKQVAGEKGEKMGWTILRPVAFMDNLKPGMPTKVFLAAMRDTMQDKPMQWISVDDIGLFAAKAFRDHQKWNARAEGLAGDELTFEELSGVFDRITGYPAPATYGFFGGFLKYMVAEVRLMLDWFAAEGYGVEVQRLRGIEPELCNFERWLKEKSPFVKQ